jgi:hypothetical protein
MAASRLRAGGGKSGLHGNTVPGNARRGRPQGKCHREQTAGARSRGLSLEQPPARVKGCGKSAPRGRRRPRHGKPHREQDRIGAAGRPVLRDRCRRGAFPPPPPGWVARGVRQRTSQRNGHPWPARAGTEPGLQAVWHLLLLPSLSSYSAPIRPGYSARVFARVFARGSEQKKNIISPHSLARVLRERLASVWRAKNSDHVLFQRGTKPMPRSAQRPEIPRFYYPFPLTPISSHDIP